MELLPVNGEGHGTARPAGGRNMRRLAMVSALVSALIGLGACAAPEAPPVVFANSGWRTSTGAPLSIGEVQALRESCELRRVSGPIDSDRPARRLLSDNPAYKPGGEGLANAPATGIAAADRPIEPGTRRAAPLGAGSAEECLFGRGLRKGW